MNYIVHAPWEKGIVGWLIVNTTGAYGWAPRRYNNMEWQFEKGEDATAFKLKFGL